MSEHPSETWLREQRAKDEEKASLRESSGQPAEPTDLYVSAWDHRNKRQTVEPFPREPGEDTTTYRLRHALRQQAEWREIQKRNGDSEDEPRQPSYDRAGRPIGGRRLVHPDQYYG
jgi:hypothetical protein